MKTIAVRAVSAVHRFSEMILVTLVLVCSTYIPIEEEMAAISTKVLVAPVIQGLGIQKR